LNELEPNPMSTEEIKSVFHESIENIDDRKFLEAVKIVIESKYKSSPSLVISGKHKKLLDDSEKQIKNGEFYTDEEVKKISDKWLKDNMVKALSSKQKGNL